MTVFVAFIRNESTKLIASLIVGAFFLFFWLNGPLGMESGFVQLAQSESIFSLPKLVDANKKTIINEFNTIENGIDEKFGFDLISDKENEFLPYGLIDLQDDKVHLSTERASELIEHIDILEISDESIQIMESGGFYYAIIQKGAKQQSIYFESKDIVHGVRGYAGSINIGLVINQYGSIESLSHISSKETNTYLQKINRKGFYNQFVGLELSDGELQIDAISGATLTTKAIAKTVTTLVEKTNPEPLKDLVELNGFKPFSVKAYLSNSWVIHVIVIFLLFFFGLQKRWKKTKRRMVVLQLISVVYIGFFLNNSFTYISFIHPFVGTSVSSFVGLYALFTLFGAIWGKNTYCKYVCPFGNAQRLLLRMNVVGKKRFLISSRWLIRVRGALTIILISGVLLGIRNWSNFELYPDFFGVDLMSGWFILATLIVFINMRFPMIWCRLLCPTGSILDFISHVVKKYIP